VNALVHWIDRKTAWRRLHRSGLHAWLKPLAKKRASTARIELTLLPYYLVTFGESSTKLRFLASAQNDHVARFNHARLRWRQCDEGQVLPAIITPQLAEQHAQAFLSRAALASGRSAQAIGVPLSAELVAYPYWVYYYQRSAGKLDAKLLDAVTGAPAGPRVKSAFLAAILSR
jgi:hypothetical protein